MGAYADIKLRIKDIDKPGSMNITGVSGGISTGGDEIFFLINEGKSSRHLNFTLDEKTITQTSRLKIVEDISSPMLSGEPQEPEYINPGVISHVFETIRKDLLTKLKNGEIVINDDNRLRYLDLFGFISGVINTCYYANHLKHQVALVCVWG